MRSRPGCFGARDRALGVCAIWPQRSRSASRRASRGCASMSDSGRSASICAAPAFGPRGARPGFWSRFRPSAPRSPNRLRRPTAATLRRLRTSRRPPSTGRRRRIRASCGPSMRRAVLARRILRSLPRSAPTRRAVASSSRPCSGAPISTAATNSSASLPGGKPSPGSRSAGRSRARIGAVWSRFLLRRYSAATESFWVIAVLACSPKRSTRSRRRQPMILRPLARLPKAPPIRPISRKRTSLLRRRKLPTAPPQGTPPSTRMEASRLRLSPRRARPRRQLNARPKFTSFGSRRFLQPQTSFRFAPALWTD